MRVIEVGQFFVTKDTGDLRQFCSVVCREHILPRDDPASEATGYLRKHENWICTGSCDQFSALQIWN